MIWWQARINILVRLSQVCQSKNSIMTLLSCKSLSPACICQSTVQHAEKKYVQGGLQIQPRFYFHPALVDVVLWLVFLSLLARRAPSAVSATCVCGPVISLRSLLNLVRILLPALTVFTETPLARPHLMFSWFIFSAKHNLFLNLCFVWKLNNTKHISIEIDNN